MITHLGLFSQQQTGNYSVLGKEKFKAFVGGVLVFLNKSFD